MTYILCQGEKESRKAMELIAERKGKGEKKEKWALEGQAHFVGLTWTEIFHDFQEFYILLISIIFTALTVF